MANLIIPVGIPGCGKSTWAHTLLDRKYAVVSSDQIRKELFGSLRAAHDVPEEERVKNNEKVFNTFHRNLIDALSHSVDAYADATNLNRRARKRLRSIAEETNARVHIVLFDNVQQAWNRNRLRNDEDRVPEEVMTTMMAQFIKAKDAIKPIVPFEGEPYDSVTVIAGVE